MKIGYARVSTGEQDTAAQSAALKAAGCDLIFREKGSGNRWDRPELGKKTAADAARLFGVHRATVTRLLQRKLAA